MANQLQKLKKLINPQQVQMSGQIRSTVSKGVYRVQPLGQDVGVVVCTSSLDLYAGDRVSFVGNEITGTIPKTGSLSFVEV